MAIDYFLSKMCKSNNEPILRFYGWSPYCVSIGCHQKNELIDFDKLKNSGYDYVKRPTGGRAILHAEELTYSVILPRKALHHRLLYKFVHQIFVEALKILGYAVELKTDNEKIAGLTHQANDFPCFTKSAQTEIQYLDKKLMGSAQKIYDDVILQHGSLLIGENHEDLPHYLEVDHNSKNLIKKEIKEKTTCLNKIKKSPISPEKIIENIINQLELVRGISVNSQKLAESEIESSKKYLTKFI
jgi:lipoate-protein ligase A